ncbi:MAG: 4-vinyl reductase [archaeon]
MKISPWLMKLISLGAFQHENGELKIFNTPVWLYPLDTSVVLYKTLVDKLGQKEVAKIFFDLGKQQSLFGLNQQLKVFGFKKNFKFLKASMDQPKTLGYGNLEIIKADFKKKHLVFRCLNTPFARKYKELYGKQEFPVDDFILGSCAGCYEFFFGEGYNAREVQCIGKGDNLCVFEIKIS